MSPYAGIPLDVDGVLADTIRLWLRLWGEKSGRRLDLQRGLLELMILKTLRIAYLTTVKSLAGG